MVFACVCGTRGVCICIVFGKVVVVFVCGVCGCTVYVCVVCAYAWCVSVCVCGRGLEKR